jgi:hypothetical protein
MVTPEKKEYWGAVEDFLRDASDMEIESLVIVGLCPAKNEAGVHDVISVWQAGPFELMQVASTLQLHASYEFTNINNSEEEPTENE